MVRPQLTMQVGLVSQEPALFNGTVLDNVRIGKADATLEEVQAACEVANAREFIERQPANYETLLGEGGGIALSGAIAVLMVRVAAALAVRAAFACTRASHIRLMMHCVLPTAANGAPYRKCCHASAASDVLTLKSACAV